MPRHNMTKVALAASLLVAGAAAAPAFAASDEDLTAIRGEIKAMRQDYEHKIDSLERRLAKAEAEAKSAKAAVAASGAKSRTLAATTTTAPQTAATVATTPVAIQSAPVVFASAPEPQAAVPSAPVGPGAFNPGIAAVLNGSYSFSQRDPATLRVPGFALGDEAGLFQRGFSLGESEIAASANVDQAFLANLILSFHNDNTLGVEEAYIQSTSLPDGFTAKLGRFFSGVGYLNEKHAHDWEFVDAPLPYRAMLGTQYGDDGAQVRWLAPTDFFLEFGAELFRGDSFPAANAHGNGPGTVTAFVHSGTDIDESSSILAGLSYLRTNANNRQTDGGDIFSGTDDLGIASLVYKWAPKGNPVVTNLILNGEYFFGHEQGRFDGVPVDYNRTGWYVQGVYQFMPQWRVGLRYAAVQTADVPLALAGSTLDDLGHSPGAASAQLEYDTSEFGRFRLEYTFDDADIQSNNELIATYTVIIGPHGAHRF